MEKGPKIFFGPFLFEDHNRLLAIPSYASENNCPRGCPFARGGGAAGSLKSLAQHQFRISGMS
jgi:hypothetical protein